MATKDIALGASGDLLIEDGDFVIINSVRQAIQIKLRWIKGEWCFDTSKGTPYFETILKKNYSLPLVEKALKEQILSVDGVTGVPSLEIEVEPKTRNMKCKFTAQTTEGEITEEVNLNGRAVWRNG